MDSLSNETADNSLINSFASIYRYRITAALLQYLQVLSKRMKKVTKAIENEKKNQIERRNKMVLGRAQKARSDR